MKKIEFLSAFFSPFVRPKLRFYFGKIQVGVPYFFPRKWVRATPQMARKATLDYIKNEESYNKLNPNYARKIRPYDEVYQEKLRCQYAVPKKIGFDLVGLGWKTKWTDTDYRFEWSPLLSFVFFKWQFVIKIVAPHPDEYWCSWLYYTRDTDKSKSKRERIYQTQEEFSQKYRQWQNGIESQIDYYPLILKQRFVLPTKQETRDKKLEEVLK